MMAIGRFEMEFGPEIKVDGKRPEWLGSYDGNLGYIRSGYDQYGPGFMWTERDILANRKGWETVTGLFIPANHPHYITPTPDERAVAPELVEKMRVILKRLADNRYTGFEWHEDAVEIFADLEPVDPDTLEAKKAMAEAGWVSDDQCYSNALEACEIAIKRGRALASRAVTPCTRAQFEEACRS